MEIITRSRYSIEKVGIFDLSEFEKQGDFSHKVLIDEIIAQGDRIGQTSNVKAPMTEWNMCYESMEFQKLGSIIVREGIIPYLGAYYNNIEDIKLNAQHYVVNLLKEKVDTKENLLLNQINCLFIISI